MKKFAPIRFIAVFILSCFAVFVFSLAYPAQAATSITILVNGRAVASDVNPYIDNQNRTMVPIRFVAEALGSQVGWDPVYKKVSIKRRDAEVLLWVGKKTYTAWEKNMTMDTVPTILPPGRTMVPSGSWLRLWGQRWSGWLKPEP